MSLRPPASIRPFRDVLPSGLTVVTVEAPALHSAMSAAYVRVGSRHEDARSSGVSHALEHLLFRGSKRWPDSVRMHEAVEAVGGNLNAVTMRDSTSFFSPSHPDGVALTLDVLGDLLSRPKLRALDTEKKVILEEMLDEVDERGRDIDLDNLSKRALYGDHPLALKIAGTRHSVRALTRAQVLRHHRRHYVAGNVVVCVAGPVKRHDVVRWARRAFRHLPPGPRVSEAPPAALPRTGARLTFVPLVDSRVEFRLSFPAVSELHPDSAGLDLLRRVLDDGLSSRLPYTIVEQRGLAYDIFAVYEAWGDCGAFEIDGACAPGKVRAVASAVLENLATLRAGQIARAELVRAKRRFRMHLDFLKDSPGELCGWFGGSALFREPPSFDAKAAQAEAVTLADLKRLARQYLVADALQVVAVGPREAKKPLAQVTKRAAAMLGP